MKQGRVSLHVVASLTEGLDKTMARPAGTQCWNRGDFSDPLMRDYP